MPKAHVIGVPFIAIAVALPSFVAFIVTQQNGVDSIDTLSLRLANATMYSVSSRIRKRLQDEPETEIRAAKRTLELGVRTLEKKDDAYWIRRSHDWVLSSGIFTGAMNILVLDDAGPYGGGIAVDAPGGVILYYSPPTFYTQSMDTNSIPTGPLVGPRNLLLNTRPYVTVFEDDAELTANEPRWTDVEVTVTGTGLANSGLFSSISIPVFFPGQAPSRESFYAVSVLLFWLNIIDLSPYLLSEGSSILIIDSDRQLVVSTDHEQPFFQSGNASDGSPVYTTYHLYNCRVPKLEATDAILGNLSQFNDEDDHFDKVTSGGDTYWVTMKTVVHYNRRWFILMWTPEKTFFAQIDAANEKTLITVVMLVIGCTLVAAVLGYLATLPLKTLARAFDKVADMDLDHPDVNAVKHTQFISELDSLHNGFWHAVQMVKQVKAFLPIRDETSGAETESTPRDIIHCSSPSGADNPVIHSKKGKPELIVEVFALGIKVSWMATLLVASFEGFCNICLSDASRALSVHSDLFQRFSESAKVHRGVVSGLQGNRFLVAWNTSRPCQVASSKVNSVSMVFDIMAAINCTVSFGLHHAPTFYGILGSKSQRFNVVGSEIVDTAALLASYATRMVLTPSVLMSGSMIEYLENFVFYMIDDDFRAVGSSIKLYWVEKRFVAKTDEWMYELARLAEQKEAFLDPFFGFVQDEMFTEADEYLNRFSEDHRMFDRHVALLRSNLDKRRAAAKKSNMSRFLESSPSLTAAFGG